MSGNSPIKLLNCILLGMMLSLALSGLAQTNVTPTQWLSAQPKPQFKPGHRLPHLTRWGWQLSSNTCVELARSWGYTLPFDMSNGSLNDLNAGRPGAGFLWLATNFPNQFKISVILDRKKLSPTPNAYYCLNADGDFVDIHSNVWSDASSTQFVKSIGPEVVPEYEMLCSSNIAYSLVVIQAQAPVAMVLNGGEYDLDIPNSSDRPAWSQDPRVTTARGTNAWGQYISEAKARKLSFLRTNVLQIATNRQFHIFYKTDAERLRTIYSLPAVWYPSWGWQAEALVPQFDLPSFESYYEGVGSAVWVGDYDLLTAYLNSVGYNRTLGYKTNYSWVCGGWQHSETINPDNFADLTRYTGFLKCLYTGGMIGGVAGYFYEPPGGFDAPFAANNPPHWLRQIEVLARVHAQFSWLDDYLFEGDLLAGSRNHQYSIDQPAYEFTNTVADATCRVLARKLNAENNWLVTAWTAKGPNRNVTVSIPMLGNVTLHARDNGAVYTATTNGVVLLNELGQHAGPFSPPTSLRIISTNSL